MESVLEEVVGVEVLEVAREVVLEGVLEEVAVDNWIEEVWGVVAMEVVDEHVLEVAEEVWRAGVNEAVAVMETERILQEVVMEEAGWLVEGGAGQASSRTY